ncbi:MAG: kelch repeat-containing protein [Crocinitomicaceae bacterium]
MKLVLTLFLLVSTLFAFGQNQNYWTKKNNFPGLKRERTISFSILTKGYVGMGIDTADNVMNDLWEFDAATSSWTQKASLPGSVRRNAVAFTLNKIGYVATGMDSAVATTGETLNDMWAYDPASNQWAQKADFPGANSAGIYFATAFSINNKGYICGGKIGPNNYSNELWEYKPSIDTWAQLSNFPGGVRYQLASFAVENKGYIGLGVDQNIYRQDMWEYNPTNGNWQQMADFPGGVRGGAVTFSLQQRGFITLGGDGGFKKDLWEYNPFSDTWAIRSEFGGSARKNAFAFTIGNYAYVGTGKGASGKKESVYQYAPFNLLSVEKTERKRLLIFPNPSANGLVSITTPETGTITIQSLSGKKVYTGKITDFQTNINTQHLAPGVYFLTYEHSNLSVSITDRLIIQ